MSQRGVRQLGGALFRDPGQDGLLHRAFLRGEGFGEDDVRRSPVIGIANSASELNPCNAGLADLAGDVKDGIRAAGGLPLEFPTISISEPFTRPTSLYLRNLMSIDVEEMLSTAPVDGVVLLGGCDKTVPAQLMGAISAGKPAVQLVAGPRTISSFRDKATFTIDDIWAVCEQRRLGAVDDDTWREVEGRVNVSVGTCNVMGTATTMGAVAEMLGFATPGSTLAPAVSHERRRLAHAAGRQAVESTRTGRRPRDLVSMSSLENAFRIVCALGGSTNAVIHLQAIAGRAGITLPWDLLAQWSASTPYVANVRPGGPHLLSDLAAAGGIPAVAHRIRDLLHDDVLAVDGRTWGQVLDGQRFTQHAAISAPEGASSSDPALVLLHGNLAPRGAIFKTAGSHDPRLRRHRGRAVVFDGIDDLNARIDDPALDVDPDSVLVLRGMGVLGAPGMPEVGSIPIPARLRRQGVRDMLRVSDARMSGTSTGSIVLHVTPEAAAGGPLGRLCSGDEIELDVDAGTIRHLVSDDALQRRAAYITSNAPARGFAWLHQQHVLQADGGCDFDFLRDRGVEA